MTSAEKEMQFCACHQRCLQVSEENHAFWVNWSKRFECKWNKRMCASQWPMLQLILVPHSLCSTTSGWGSGIQVRLSQGFCDCHILRHVFACLPMDLCHFSSDFSRLAGSSTVGMLAWPSTCHTRSFRALWRGILLALHLQVRPCVLSGSILALQGYLCGSQSLAPRPRSDQLDHFVIQAQPARWNI